MIKIPVDGQIALVDDDELDRMITSRVLAISNLQNSIIEYSSAQGFIDDVTRRSERDDLGLALVLIYINMPGMGGLEALEHIRSEIGLERFPVIVMLTSSEAGTDMLRAKELGAQSYLAKQSGIDKFVAAVNDEFANA